MGDVLLPGYRHVYSGKVRDLYLPLDRDDRILVVASDRISAFDHVLASAIPEKGRILTRLSLWWFERVADLAPHHVISADDVPAEVHGRAVLCERLAMHPVECVARGYLAGSGLAEYRLGGAVCGVALPPGLVEGSRLPEPVFTPASKAPQGHHDENVTYEVVAGRLGPQLAAELRRLTLEVYTRGERVARDRGLLLADTKLEFGSRPDGSLVLADELLTPDSSRYWPADEWRPGGPQRSYDKQSVRDWLASPTSGWDRTSDTPPPPLPDEVVERTREGYVEAYERLTGAPWPG